MATNPTWNRALPNLAGRARLRKRRTRPRFSASVAWSVLALAAVATAFAFAPSENKYPCALAGAFVFFLIQWFSPACRPVSGKLLCPWNWALFVFFLQLVLLPFSVLVSGPSMGVLPFLPSDRAINLAMLINAAAFISFCMTYHYFAHTSRIDQNSSEAQLPLSPRQSMSLSFIALNGAIGIMGFFLAFGALDKVA